MVRITLKRVMRSIGVTVGICTLSMSFSLSPITTMIASAAGNSVSVGSPIAAGTGQPVTIPNATVSGNGTLTVNVSVTEGTIDLPSPASGVTYASNITNGKSVSMTGAATDITTALHTMTYTGASAGTKQIHIAILPQNGVYDPVTKHMYTFDATKRTQTAANTFATTQSVAGVPGYMATVTSAAEESLLEGLSVHGWIGATYQSGNFAWTGGPETGQRVDSFNYNNWAPGEPDELRSGVTQDCTILDDSDGNGAKWYASQCSPSVAYRYGTFVEYDVSSVLISADQQVNVSTPVHDIATCAELQAMANNPSESNDIYRLTGDIDCQNAPFTSLLWGQSAFGGTFDGQGHTIRGLNITTTGTNDAGLFSYTSGATLKNVTLGPGTGVHALDTGGVSGYAGALVGYAGDTQISNVSSALDVTSDQDEAGGLVGELFTTATSTTSSILGSSSTGNVHGNSYVGGLAGSVNSQSGNISIEQSFATGTVIADEYIAGGLIGYTDAYQGTLTIKDVYATGNVSIPGAGTYWAGGLVGETDVNAGGVFNLSNAYASGTVTADDYLGGLIGDTGYSGNEGPITLTNVFTVSKLVPTNTNPQNVGFIIGENDGTGSAGPATGSAVYYDSVKSDVASLAGVACSTTSVFVTCQDGNSNNTAPNYFVGNRTNAPMNTWDFNGIWILNLNGLPTFGSISNNGGGNGNPAGGNPATQSGSSNNTSGVSDLANTGTSILPLAVTGMTLLVGGGYLLRRWLHLKRI